MIERECACCGTRTKADAPDRVTAPVQYGPRLAGLGTYLWHGQFLSREQACTALGEMFGCAPSPAVIAAAKKIAAFIQPAVSAIVTTLLASAVVHFDETGFRVAGMLAWVHSASAGNYVLTTVHPKRGTEGMNAAGVLPSFTGIAVHGAWAPYDTYTGVAGHALCNAHLLRGLTAVTETGSKLDVIWPSRPSTRWSSSRMPQRPPATPGTPGSARRCLPGRRGTSPTPRRPGSCSTPPAAARWRKSGMPWRTGCGTGAGDYLRFAYDLRFPFDNNPAEQAIRMSKLKVSGCMRSMTGARPSGAALVRAPGGAGVSGRIEGACGVLRVQVMSGTQADAVATRPSLSVLACPTVPASWRARPAATSTASPNRCPLSDVQRTVTAMTPIHTFVKAALRHFPRAARGSAQNAFRAILAAVLFNAWVANPRWLWPMRTR
jgi:Transposase IS66 family